MVDPASIVGFVIGVALLVYALTGGADFGGGVWDLTARGPRGAAMKKLAADAIAPIWEANHVWMIVVVVLLFVCFPKAFSVLSIALHVPLTIMLVGIVLRGSAFTFRAYGMDSPEVAERWGTMFAVSSVVTPIMLGVSVGAIVSGNIRVDPETNAVLTGFYAPWLTPFGFSLGLFFLAICAYLAAVYLSVEADGDRPLQDDFRARALGAGVAVGGTAFVTLALSASEAPHMFEMLTRSAAGLGVHTLTGAAALGGLWALWARRFRLARLLVGAQTVGIFAGWGLSQYPYIVYPDLTISNSAAIARIQWGTLGVLVCGAVLLVPAMVWLYAVFKRPVPGADAPGG